MSYEQKAEDWHINQVCNIEDNEIKEVESGEINKDNSYKIQFDGSRYYLLINGSDFDDNTKRRALKEIVELIMYYENFRNEKRC